MHLNKPVVGMAATSRSGGYWLVASDGGIFSFGDAAFYGSTGNIALNKPVVGMAATPDGGGYWSVASDGGIFAFGDAQFYGSMGAQHLNQPIVGMTATPDGGGYWLVASDGGIFAFGDAAFYGSTGNIHLNQPIVGMTATPDGHGYWFTASDGGVFAFGDAQFFGSLGNVPQKRPIVAITSDASGSGYWFANSNGAVSAFGDATYWGSAPRSSPSPSWAWPSPSVRAASPAPPTSRARSATTSPTSRSPATSHPTHTPSAWSRWSEGRSCRPTSTWPPRRSSGPAEASNLYVYLTDGQDPNSGDPACNSAAAPYVASALACNYGFNTAVDAFTKASAAGVNTSVGWWLDVEKDPSWSTDLAANAAMIQGAIDGLHYEGLNGVGIYASPGSWKLDRRLLPTRRPYWAASWGIDPATTCANVRSQFSSARLPSGPVQLVQYSSPSTPTPHGGMSTSYDDDYAC